MDRGGASDAELLDAWRAGARDAGDELLRRHFLAVLRFFTAHPGVDAEDLTQRTFEACITSRDRVQDRFVAYLFGIARNQLLREWERKGRRAHPVSSSGDSIMAHATSPSMRMAKYEEQRLFAQALAGIPREFAAVLEAFYWDDRSIPEIAARLGIAEGTVKSRLFRGRALLRTWLQDAEADDALRSGTLSLLERAGAAVADEDGS